MKLRYLGPSPQVPVGDGAGGVVTHAQGQVENYTEEIGQDLLRCPRNRFELVEEPIPAEGGTAEPAREAPGGTVAALEPGGGAAVAPADEVPTAAGVGGQAPRKAKGKGKG